MADVVVVGAGPIGLWLASELDLQGVSVSIVERNHQRDVSRSKAVDVQANTLDAVTLRGLDALLLRRGTPVGAGHLGAASTTLDFSAIHTPHPYMLAIPQWSTEEFLEEHVLSLGIEIRRDHELVSLSQDGEGVDLVLRARGKHQVERAAFVVGCDGSHSTVRIMSGIDFPGTSTTITAWLADVELTSPPGDAVTRRTTGHGSIFIAALGAGVHRIAGFTIASMHLDTAVPVSMEDVRSETRAMFGTDFGMHSPHWLSRFGNATRQADRYRSGRVLLAGDAAHQFFPAGAQGMSLGLQDAMNLGWKLAATLQGWGPDALLDSYDIERRVAGRDVMNNTLAQVALFAAATPEQQELREAVSECLEQPETNRLWARRVGGFAEPVRTWGRHAGHPLTGTRASEVKLSIGVPHPLLAEGRFVLLDLTTGGVDLDKLATPHADRVEHHHCQLVDGPEGWSDATAVLIRPDARVAWATTESNPDQCRSETAAVLDYWFSSRS